MALIAAAALLVGGAFSWIASSQPDGLEWSVERTTAGTEITLPADEAHLAAAALQKTTAALPDYGTSAAGLAGCGAILLAAWGGTRLLRIGRKRA